MKLTFSVAAFRVVRTLYGADERITMTVAFPTAQADIQLPDYLPFMEALGQKGREQAINSPKLAEEETLTCESLTAEPSAGAIRVTLSLETADIKAAARFVLQLVLRAGDTHEVLLALR